MAQRPISERSILVGDLIVINGYKANRATLIQRFAQGGYQAQESLHFQLFTRNAEPSTILVHNFAPADLHADIKHYLMYELKPLGLLTRPERFGQILSGIIGSFTPEDARYAWQNYSANTLRRFLLYLATARSDTPIDYYATTGVFANLYQRVCELCRGESFLDAGCESGYLPLIIAQRIPFMHDVVGLDLAADMLSYARELATEWHLDTVRFLQMNLLDAQLARLGQFDTVVALHVIEHFTEAEMYDVLKNLLRVTRQRLLLAVPYEEEPEAIYEHRQTFTRDKLLAVGEWCIAQMGERGERGGRGRLWCEECEGGLLLIERR